ncbi:MAG: FtsX-like permease family protein [Cyclobacteriaceae bacterium]|nr:ABC transporter permease [Cyclobacteriaceae bacterium]HNP95781.1 ABC transporter permease [Cyclobacteriaceae bacterium]
MLKTLVKLGLRNLFRKHKLFTVANLISLAVGLTVLWLVSLFIYDEYTFDKRYTLSERTFRLVVDFNSEGNITSWAKSSAPIGKFLSGMFPEIDQVTRLRKNPGTDLISVGDRQFFEPQFFFADSTFFNVFRIPFISGNQQRALDTKNSVVLSESLALKLFGTTDALGQSLTYNQDIELMVTGIMADMYSNSHFVADAIATFSTLHDLFGEQRLNHWGQFDHYTYVLLNENVEPGTLEAKLPQLIKAHAPEWVSEKETLLLQPISSIHLHSDRKDEISPNSSPVFSLILGSIAIFILIMASSNYINFATAIQIKRNAEIGIQKALGASNSSLGFYFLVESISVCFLAFVISSLLTYWLLPSFNLASGKSMDMISNLWISIPLMAVCILIALVTALFPYLQSRRRLAGISKTRSARADSRLRTSLISFQLSISIFLIIATWVVSAQIHFLKTARYGFNSDSVIVIPIKDRAKNMQSATICNELEKLPGISRASFSSSTPGSNNSLTYTYSIVDSDAGEQAIATFLTDERFYDLYDITLKEGRLLNPLTTDTLSDVILNEAAVKLFNLKHPIGSIVSGKVSGRVVGIVRDFNHTSLHHPFQPVIMYHFNPTLRIVSVRLNDIKSGIASLMQKWPQIYDNYPLEYEFLNDQIQSLYGSEFRLSAAYRSFSVIAILIACMGLIGLTSYLLNQKLKEISIRKVFGSSTYQIISWIYKGYVPVILIATLLAAIAGYYLMDQWLKNFSFRIELSLSHFIIPPLVMTIVLLASTGLQSVRAALTNPADNLREN